MYDELKITYLSGPMELPEGRDRAVVLCVVKDGAVLIDEFIEHYLNLGFEHVIFLDNGSTDDTIARAQRHSRVTVLQSLANFGKHKLRLKHALIRIFGIGRWSLIADIDEFFQFPLMHERSLKSFIGYLNKNNYTTMVAQMIDLLPSGTLQEIREQPIMTTNGARWYFSTDDIVRSDYDVPSNRISSPEIKFWHGGVRKRVFDMEPLFLTKHPLNFGSGEIKFVSSHVMGSRYVADISGIILHYKFVGDFFQRTVDAVESKQFYRQSQEYRQYLDAFETTPELMLGKHTDREFTGYQSLADADLFTISESYKADN